MKGSRVLTSANAQGREHAVDRAYRGWRSLFAAKLNPKIKRAPSSRELDPCEGVRPWHSLDRGAKFGSP
jgi:hypothetical protein